MEKQGKVWGATTLICRTPHLTIHLLEIKAGGFSSEHRHAGKANLFYVLSGALEIKQWRDGNAEPDETCLGPDQATTVPAGIWHRFKALTDVRAIEICAAEAIDNDIDRRTRGGREAPGGQG